MHPIMPSPLPRQCTVGFLLVICLINAKVIDSAPPPQCGTYRDEPEVMVSIRSPVDGQPFEAAMYINLNLGLGSGAVADSVRRQPDLHAVRTRSAAYNGEWNDCAF